MSTIQIKLGNWGDLMSCKYLLVGFLNVWLNLGLQDGGCGRPAFREEEVDSLFRECHLHHVPGGAQRVRPGPRRVRQ